MPLYNRADLEQELEIIDAASAMLSRKVLSGEITGLQCLRLDFKLEEMRRRAKGKLFKTRQLVAEIRDAENWIQSASNNLRAHPSSNLAKQALKAAEHEKGRAIGNTKFNPSPFRVKSQDGSIITEQEAMNGH